MIRTNVQQIQLDAAADVIQYTAIEGNNIPELERNFCKQKNKKVRSAKRIFFEIVKYNKHEVFRSRQQEDDTWSYWADFLIKNVNRMRQVRIPLSKLVILYFE